MFSLSMLGPEFIFMLALGEYMHAHASVKLFHDEGYESWTIKHGFYANMGGFILQCKEWKPFPVDAKQLLYLVTRGYITYPETSDDLISDLDKSDGLARLVPSHLFHKHWI